MRNAPCGNRRLCRARRSPAGCGPGGRNPTWGTPTEKTRDLTLKTAIFRPQGELPRSPDETRNRSKPCEAKRRGLKKKRDFFRAGRVVRGFRRVSPRVPRRRRPRGVALRCRVAFVTDPPPVVLPLIRGRLRAFGRLRQARISHQEMDRDESRRHRHGAAPRRAMASSPELRRRRYPGSTVTKTTNPNGVVAQCAPKRSGHSPR